MTDYEVLTAALGNKVYLENISNDPDKQLKNFTYLKKNNFDIKKIIHLISDIKDPAVRSIFTLHLLSRKDYIDNINGESILNTIKYSRFAVPSRLNPWLFKLDVSILSPQLISEMSKEAAVSILCFFPYFHLLKKEQTYLIIKKLMDPDLLAYWMNYYVYMPNSHYILAQLFKILSGDTLRAIAETSENKRILITENIIAHLDLFSEVFERIKHLFKEETQLILAMKLYQSHHHHPVYLELIKFLSSKLLEQGQLGATSINLLFSLGHISELKELIQQTNPFLIQLIKQYASEGNYSQFEEKGIVSWLKCTREIVHASSNDRSYVVETVNYPFAPNAIEFYISYFEGESQFLKKLLHDYLSLAQNDVEENVTLIHHLAILLQTNILKPQIKTCIFQTLLEFPKFHDEFISLELFRYNHKELAEYLTTQNKLQDLIPIIKYNLKSFETKKDKKSLDIAEHILNECLFETKLKSNSHFYSKFLNWIKRCFFYGWKKLFIPLSPTYVKQSTSPKTKADFASDDKFCYKSFPELLEELQKQNVSQNKLQLLFQMLEEYSLDTSHENELATRLKFHNFIYKVSNDLNTNDHLLQWLHGNPNPLVSNKIRLIELILLNLPLESGLKFIKKILINTEYLVYISQELELDLPKFTQPVSNNQIELLKTETLEPITQVKQKLEEYITNTADVMKATWNIASNIFKNGFQEPSESNSQSSANNVASKCR